MKRLKKYHSLIEVAPTLVKEWHPTANGNLTPRNLDIIYPKRVWWICSEGHEWQATIQYRLNQKDCPICNKEGMKKETASSISIPTNGKNDRKNRRFQTKTTAVIEVPDSGHWVYAEMIDFSSHGLCFETEASIQPGTLIRIKFDKTLVSSRLNKSLKSSINNGYKTYNSTVKWCKQLDEDQSFSSFGIGVELF
ncbi:zinc-ribbon domain-containing protein [bacterium]|nr:zinc-ribbon domain-containing protein [bacterium]